MERTFISDSTIDHVQVLAQCDISKEDLTDAVEYFRDVLQQFDMISIEAPKKFSYTAKLVGGKLFEKFIKLLGNHDIADEMEYYEAEDTDDVIAENTAFTKRDVYRQSATDEDYEPPEKITVYDSVPFDMKLKIVMAAKEHPQWSFRTLQQRFKKHLHRQSDVARFRKYVLAGGTFKDKMEAIKTYVYDRFTEAREHKQLVTRRLMQQWAMAKAAQYHDTKGSKEHTDVFRFVASHTWMTTFLREYRISSRRVVRYVSKKETVPPEAIIESATQFQAILQALISDYNSDFVINTDQTSCEYRVNEPTRTCTHTGEKLVELYIGDLNKVSHSYTAQYSITKSGKLLPKVFLCLQEFADNFGMRVQKDVNDLLKICRNVVVVCSKSGKLTTLLYEQYLHSVVKPYVGNQSFLFIVDSWGGQKNIHMYNEIFHDDNNKPTCNLQIIPPKCAPICQPCDVYFYGQVKIIIKKIQNYADLLTGDTNIQLNTRVDMIRIHSLTHYLLSAPCFKCMLEYTWYALKLAATRDIFYNVDQLCFPQNIHKMKCVCGQHNAFIKCSWCTKVLCFQCFYTEFHPQQCDIMAEFYNC